MSKYYWKNKNIVLQGCPSGLRGDIQDHLSLIIVGSNPTPCQFFIFEFYKLKMFKIKNNQSFQTFSTFLFGLKYYHILFFQIIIINLFHI